MCAVNVRYKPALTQTAGYSTARNKTEILTKNLKTNTKKALRGDANTARWL